MTSAIGVQSSRVPWCLLLYSVLQTPALPWSLSSPWPPQPYPQRPGKHTDVQKQSEAYRLGFKECEHKIEKWQAICIYYVHLSVDIFWIFIHIPCITGGIKLKNKHLSPHFTRSSKELMLAYARGFWPRSAVGSPRRFGLLFFLVGMFFHLLFWWIELDFWAFC